MGFKLEEGRVKNGFLIVGRESEQWVSFCKRGE